MSETTTLHLYVLLDQLQDMRMSATVGPYAVTAEEWAKRGFVVFYHTTLN